jgi:phosphate-selective porin OprO/OprP
MSWAVIEEELLLLLKTKGIITQEEMDTLMKRVKEREQKDNTLKAFYKDGFYVQTRDKSFDMKIGGRVQGDYLAPDQDNTNDNSSFNIRRARIEASGKLFTHTKFKVQLDFGQGKDALLKDGYLDFNYFKWAQLKIGQFKEPFSLEELTSSKYIDFLERSTVVSNLSPSRDIGMMLHSEFAQGALGYSLGIFNGNGANQKRDENDDKDIAARLYFRPFAHTKAVWLKGLQLAANSTIGNQAGTIKDIKTPTSGIHLVEWTDGVKSDGRRSRFGMDLAWVMGPFSLKGEYIRTDWDNVQFGAHKEDFDIYGWYVSGSIFLTGEKKPYKAGAFGRLKKIHQIFDPSKGSWGAWELVARYDTLRIDKDIFTLGYGIGTNRIRTFTLGLNWYPYNMVTMRLNYVRNSYKDNLEELKGDDKEGIFLTRFQVEF